MPSQHLSHDALAEADQEYFALAGKYTRLREAAQWLIECHDAVLRGDSVTGLGEAWEGLRHAAAMTGLEQPHGD